ncbi:hypothetical protein [Achromobacter ruhlandii]|uniref:hypothetical protein n=1 Tax=Achromobacter ruhlandii TaxID=72557 RepID=UPI003B9903FB
MISLRAVLWLLLAGVLVFLLMGTPGVRLYDAIARRLRGRRAGPAPSDPRPRTQPAAQQQARRANQARQPG